MELSKELAKIAFDAITTHREMEDEALDGDDTENICKELLVLLNEFYANK